MNVVVPDSGGNKEALKYDDGGDSDSGADSFNTVLAHLESIGSLYSSEETVLYKKMYGSSLYY